MINETKHFLIVDDDPSNNILTKIALRKFFNEVEVKDFLMPEKALKYIESEFENQAPEEKVILLLDINMPTLTGWEFLDKFNAFKESIKNKFNIYMLSSSVDPADIQRAQLNPLVNDFIEKPLNNAIIKKMFG